MTPDQLSQKFHEEIQKSTPSQEVDLFELDLRALDPTIDTLLYFHNGSSGMTGEVRFNGFLYQAIPIDVSGIEMTSSDEPPRPTMTIANAMGFMSQLVLQLDDIVGARLTRRRTLACFLDGEPEAAAVEFPPDIFYVERKTSEDRLFVTFELGSALDLDGIKYPLRRVTSNYCSARYRATGCGFGQQMVVTDALGQWFDGAERFFGPWNATASFHGPDGTIAADSVGYSVGGVYGIYRCLSGTVLSPISGEDYSPANATYWKRVQRYRGDYSAAVTDYAVGDVVCLRRSSFSEESVPTMCYLYHVPDTGSLPSPPNGAYWKSDVCGKFLNHCVRRFDPRAQRKLLKFNGFPGTVNLVSSST